MAVIGDEVVGQVHSSPGAPVGQDEVVGGSQQDRPSLLNSAWQTIQGGALGLWHTGKGLVEFGGPGTMEPAGAGVVRGVRDVTDKLTEYPNPEYGYVPGQSDLSANRQSNAADRAAFDRQYADNDVANAGRVVGNIAATAPVIGPLSLGTGAIADATLPTAARGITGIAARGVERAFTGTTGGGAQAIMTSDPSKPILPQIGAGAFLGGVLGPVVGSVGDVGSNVYRRLSGQTVPLDSSTGAVDQKLIERATQAQSLFDEGVNVPLRLISPDTGVQASSTVGRMLPGSGMAAEDANIGNQFRSAALNKVIPNSPDTVVTKNFSTRADNYVDSLYNNSVRAVPSVPSMVPGGNTLAGDLSTIRAGVPRALDPTLRGQIDDAIDHINDTFAQGKGAISGSDYQTLTNRSTGAIAPLLNSADPTVRAIGRQIGAQLDTRLRSQMTNDQSAMYDDANATHRAWSTIKDATKSDGTFDPASLYKETQAAKDKYGGTGTLDDLAQAGNTVLQKTLETGKTGLGVQAATAAGTAIPTAALTTALKGLSLASLGDISGTTLASVGGLLGLNRAIQNLGRSSGETAVDTIRNRGGGATVADLQRALAALRMPAVAGQQDRQQ